MLYSLMKQDIGINIYVYKVELSSLEQFFI